MESAPHLGYNQGFMRRGTRSCVECRRRKIRCLYAKEGATICIACTKKGRTCQEQNREHFPSVSTGSTKKKSLKDRVAMLEALLKSSDIDPQVEEQYEASSTALHDSPEGKDASSHCLNDNRFMYGSESAFDSGDDDEDEYDPDPLVALFHNRLLQSQQPKSNLKTLDTYQPNIDLRVAAKKVHVLSRLRISLVSPVLLRDILEVTGDWFKGWRPLGPWPIEYTVAAGYSTLQDFLLFAYNSDSPAVMGLAVLCIAESIRKLQVQTPTHLELIRQLPRPPQELFQILFEQVDRLINSDTDFSNTKEGIDCLLMSGKLFSSLGIPRRTWITFHKAIIYCQYHGINCAIPRSGESKEQARFRQDAWDSLCQTDLFLSMTLGLPYITAGRSIPLKYFGEPGNGERFRRQIMGAAAQLIDRNQSGLTNEMEPTQDIIQALDDAVRPMSAEFWSAPDVFTQIDTSPERKRRLIEETRWQMFYWLIAVFTYLPLSIRSLEEPELEQHRLSCQTACRGHLRIYNILRSDKRADLANLIDYQAFISCSILILGLLGYGSPMERGYELMQQDNADRELVALTLQTLKEASETNANAIAGQALEGISGLFRLANPKDPGVHERQDVKTEISIPYIGTITVAPGVEKHSRPSTANTPSYVPAPTFTFMYPEMYSPQLTQQYYASEAMPQEVFQPQSYVTQPPLENKLIQPSMGPDYTSINFDFDHLMAMNTEDWTWVSAEYPAENYY